MIHQNTIRHSIYVAVVIIILTLSGIFTTFASREVIKGELVLSTVVLVMMTGGAAYLVAAPVKDQGILASLANGLIGTASAALTLAVIVYVETENDLRFVFQNLLSLNGSTLTAGKAVDLSTGEIGGLLEMLGFSLVCGVLGSLLVYVPKRVRETLMLSAALTITINLVQTQINNVVTLPDALGLLVTFGAAYAITRKVPSAFRLHVAEGAGIGIAMGVVVALAGSAGALDAGGVMRGNGGLPVILGMTVEGSTIGLLIVLAVVGSAGALAAGGSRAIHDGFLYLFTCLLVLGLLNWQLEGGSVWVTPAGIFVLISGAIWFMPQLGERANQAFQRQPVADQRSTQWYSIALAALVFLAAPQFMGLYVSNVFNLIAMYAILGIGLNVVVGYAGLLNLGYVASFAIGAYALGILTTPSLVTCGGTHPNDIPVTEIAETCSGVMTFWTAWPLAAGLSGLAGVLLGIPVLRLRGDYLAIVTLGFGEIISRIVVSNDFKPLLGGAGGISPIPSPLINLQGINPDWQWRMGNSTSIYYLFLFGVVLTAFVVYQLSNSRVGRAWRAIRADEDVAQAVGINLLNMKLLAFGISAGLAGLGGAAFAASVQGIFPRSFTLLVSINVLSLIIIGGLGSIPGVILGSLMLIGLPELLRELDVYRLLAFGSLLVASMLIKPEGLLPPKPPQLAELVAERRAKEGVQHG